MTVTATADFMNADVPAPTTEPVRVVGGNRMLVRIAQRLVGVALIIAALGLWMAPGASWESDVMLFKLILSVTAGLAGVGLIQSSATPHAPDIEIDTIRREVRLVRIAKDGSRDVLQRCAFADLGRVEREGIHVRLWDSNNAFLAETSLSHRNALNSLVSGLRDAGKLA